MMGIILTRLFQSIVLPALLFVSFSVSALTDQPVQSEQNQSDPPPSVAPIPGPHFILNAGWTFGGDTVDSARYTNGDSTSVKGGGLLQFGLGGLYQFESSPISLLLSANYHFHNVTASNGNMTFSRFPIEFLGYYTGIERFRIGGGVRFVNSAEVSKKINGSTEKTTFDNTTGYVVEVGYHIGQPVWFNVRYVSEKYQGNTYTSPSGATISLVGTKPLNGSHIGAGFTFVF